MVVVFDFNVVFVVLRRSRSGHRLLFIRRLFLLLSEHWHDVEAPMFRATVETFAKTLLLLLQLLRWLRRLRRLMIPLLLLHLGWRQRAA